jgi:LppP/LprE lipoprotein
VSGVSARALAAASLVVAGIAPAALARSTATPRSVVRYWVHRTIEVGGTGEGFRVISRRATTRDGAGGSITAVVGLRQPSADGKGQLLFFFRGRRFLGWDRIYESIAIDRISAPRRNRIRVHYANYKPTDPLCCPTLRPVTVDYRWTGRRIRPSRPAPRSTGRRVRLR